MNAILDLKGICYKYGKKIVLKDIKLAIKEGEIISIVGPSGSGKSTLLKVISLLQKPYSGEILYKGRVAFSLKDHVNKEDIGEYLDSIGIVFQELHLWPNMTVKKNITLPLVEGKRISESSAHEIADKYLEKLKIANIANEYPQNISVGQKQRCAIARTLAMEPKILLFDEITSALDPELVQSILMLVRSIAEEHNRTFIIVTHEHEFAKSISNRIYCLQNASLSVAG